MGRLWDKKLTIFSRALILGLFFGMASLGTNVNAVDISSGIKKSYWKAFCAKHIVAVDPMPTYEEIQELKDLAVTEVGHFNYYGFLESLNELYRETGTDLYWLEKRIKSGYASKQEVSMGDFSQVRLQILGREIRHWLYNSEAKSKWTRIMDAEEMRQMLRDSLEDYGRFESLL